MEKKRRQMKREKAGVWRGTQDQTVPLRLKALTLSLRDRHQGEAVKAMRGRGWRTKRQKENSF